jgi:transposase InsO family protein
MDTATTPAPSTRTYFRPTTASQRQLLFKAAETSTVTAAAQQAHVGRGTYYHWLERYETAGAAGLAQPRSCAPQQPRLAPLSAAVCAEVLAYYDDHPHERGCRMIAARVRQAHDGQAVIGHSKVAELLRVARPAAARTAAPTAAAAAAGVVAVHAPAANQTVNIDLCVVPLTHDTTQPFTSVSVSQAAAGLAPALVSPPEAAPTWPGQVFAEPHRPYTEQMATYQAQRAAQGQRKLRRRQKQAARQALNRRSDELRVARRQQRLARQQQDAAWREARATQRRGKAARQLQSRSERRAARQAGGQPTTDWAAAQQTHRQQVAQRQTQDTAWRQARLEILSQLAALAALPLVTAWLAILVVVDNGTRRCLRLPLFVTGVHVTAAEIVTQLRQHWPPEIQFVISDNGAQFIADAFTQFAQDMAFLHVRIAPHHPQTNGIAERFVRTLKEWLAWHTWQSPEELTALLAEFIEYYNSRPHQGAELAGLSPNEFAQRLECSTC